MTRHLTDYEISDWTLGARDAVHETHLAECDACRREAETLQSALLGFRRSAQDLAVRCRVPLQIPAQPPWWKTRTPWALAAVAAALVLSIPVWREHSRRVADDARRLAAEDTQLLMQVDAGISRAVPQPMEPLVQLVAWNSQQQ